MITLVFKNSIHFLARCGTDLPSQISCPVGHSGEGVDIEFPNLELLLMSFNMWKDVIVTHLIKIKFPMSFSFDCQFELRLYMRWWVHYYKNYWLGLFFSPCIRWWLYYYKVYWLGLFFSLLHCLQISWRKVLDRKKKYVSIIFMKESFMAYSRLN